MGYSSRQPDYFNSHAHVERDQDLLPVAFLDDNFNSHAHVERDRRIFSKTIYNQGISTHTLTWSVTLDDDGYRTGEKFQLTRSRGA